MASVTNNKWFQNLMGTVANKTADLTNKATEYKNSVANKTDKTFVEGLLTGFNTDYGKNLLEGIATSSDNINNDVNKYFVNQKQIDEKNKAVASNNTTTSGANYDTGERLTTYDGDSKTELPQKKSTAQDTETKTDDVNGSSDGFYASQVSDYIQSILNGYQNQNANKLNDILAQISSGQTQYTESLNNYMNALQNYQMSDDLMNALNKVSTGRTAYSDNVENYLQQIADREPFSYDANSDALYQNYLAQMQNLGAKAMKDTLGQASALTGGYNSSYATASANGTYNDYINQANQMLPEYYNMALNQYTSEGERLQNMLNNYMNMDSTEYARNLQNFQNLYNMDSTTYNRLLQNYQNLVNADATEFDKNVSAINSILDVDSNEYTKYLNAVTNGANLFNDDRIYNANYKGVDMEGNPLPVAESTDNSEEVKLSSPKSSDVLEVLNLAETLDLNAVSKKLSSLDANETDITAVMRAMLDNPVMATKVSDKKIKVGNTTYKISDLSQDLQKALSDYGNSETINISQLMVEIFGNR